MSATPLTTSATPAARHHAAPLIAAAAGAACFTCMDSVIKLMSERFDALQLGFFRFAGGSVFAITLWLWKRSPLPAREAWRLHAIRSVLLLCSLLGYFYALTQLPLVQAMTISYLSPIFVAVLALPVLGERPGRMVWLALAAGLCGVLISVLPELRASLAGAGSRQLLGMASAALSALSFAGVMLLARRQSGMDSIWTILLVQSVLPLALLAAPALWRWQPILASDLALILLAGGLGTAGLLCLTYAFTRLEASRVVPFEYTGLVWGTGLGYAFFGELPTATTLASAALIVGGCLLLLRR